MNDLLDCVTEDFEHQPTAGKSWSNAIDSIKRVLRDGHPVQVQFSGGKDSSCCANLTLAAAKELKQDGIEPAPIYICSADTGVENPVARALAEHELLKMKDYAGRVGVNAEIHIARPTLSSSYAVRVIGGRALPPFPVGRRDCTTDWKINPSQRVTKSVKLAANKSGSGKPMVTIIGTRSNESRARAINTSKRGESADQIWLGPEGDARLSPILHWTTDDVWTYLGECASGEHESYSDFADLIEFYSAAAGGECVVVADMRTSASTPCGARSGCWVCGAVQSDTSVENMIATNPSKYGYLGPLLRFRNFVVSSQWDWSMRNFLGRTIDAEGYMSVKADQFSPQTCERLFRYMLTAQDKANAMGSPLKVRAIGLREVIAIDFYWSARAWHMPFHALQIYLEHMRGVWEEAPIVDEPVKPTPVPDIGKIFVGRDWDVDGSALAPQGLRDPVWEMFSDSCGPTLRVGRNGKTFLDLEETPEFDVDEEGACLFLDFEAERHIRELHRIDADWTSAASIYLRYGVVTLATGQSSAVDSMIRRSQWLQRQHLHGHQSVESLTTRCAQRVASQHSLFE